MLVSPALKKKSVERAKTSIFALNHSCLNYYSPPSLIYPTCSSQPYLSGQLLH